jgi:hypothetical protein
MKPGSSFTTAVMLATLAMPAAAQTASADGPWSGSVQCQLDVEDLNYSRHEVQTWTLTGKKLPPNGDMRIYAAEWTASGQGKYVMHPPGQGLVVTQWAVHVPPEKAELAFWMDRGSELLIGQWHSELRAGGALTGSSQPMSTGAQPQVQPISGAVSEWRFSQLRNGVINANLSGSHSLPVTHLIAGTFPVGRQQDQATCRWQFTKGKPDSSKCSQSAAGSAQTYDALKADVVKQFNGLIQETRDPGRSAALTSLEQSLASLLDSLKQLNLTDCEAKPGAQ